MEVEYSGGGVLIFSYHILIHQLDNFGGFARSQVESRHLDTSEFIGNLFDGPPIAARLYLTYSAKRKRRKPPRSANDGALGRLQSNYSTSMLACDTANEHALTCTRETCSCSQTAVQWNQWRWSTHTYSNSREHYPVFATGCSLYGCSDILNSSMVFTP